MRYTISRANQTAKRITKVRVPPNAEITYISWRVEGATSDLAVGWRSLAEGNNIIDPMQISDENNRVVLGYALAAGDLLDIT